MLEIDKKFNELFFKEDLVKESEKIHKKVKFSLVNGKNLNSKWNDDKNLSYLIHECINIEDSMNKINLINEEIKKNMIINKEINFITKEYEIIDYIQMFGNINVKTEDDNNNKVDKKAEKIGKKEKKSKKSKKQLEDDEEDVFGGLFK